MSKQLPTVLNALAVVAVIIALTGCAAPTPAPAQPPSATMLSIVGRHCTSDVRPMCTRVAVQLAAIR